jgi:hypothetical protein
MGRWTIVILAGLLGAASAADAAPACGRACLTGSTNAYLKALLEHRPGALKTTPDVRFTEDGAPLRLGDGLWRTIDGLGSFRLDFVDPAQDEAGALVTVQENGRPALMALRLKLRSGRISEVETILARKGELQELQTALLDRPLPQFLEDVPPAERSSRAELVRIVDSYFTAIEKADGSLVPFADDSFRIENGVRTCNVKGPPNPGMPPEFARLGAMKCADQLSTGIFTYIRSIRPRRFAVVDEDRGLVLALVRFNHPGDVLEVKTRGFGTLSMRNNPWAVRPTSALIAELFKVQDHKIQRVMAVITNTPYRMPTGWDAPQPPPPKFIPLEGSRR